MTTTMPREIPAMIHIELEPGRTDSLLPGAGRGPEQRALIDWAAQTPELHDFLEDYHRLQVERFIWDHREELRRGARVMDVGLSVGERREWVGSGYFTFGLNEGDVRGDLIRLDDSLWSQGTRATDDEAYGNLDAIICTEVLEHCENPYMACQQMLYALKPGGLFLASTPFLWPYHGVKDEYPDYWRFTHQGWQLLLKGWDEVKIVACRWTDEGAALYDLLRRFECFGFEGQTYGTTGYLVSARKGVA